MQFATPDIREYAVSLLDSIERAEALYEQIKTAAAHVEGAAPNYAALGALGSAVHSLEAALEQLVFDGAYLTEVGANYAKQSRQRLRDRVRQEVQTGGE